MHMLLEVYSMLSEAEKLCLSWGVDRAPVQLVWSYQLEQTACKAACEGRINVLTFMKTGIGFLMLTCALPQQRAARLLLLSGSVTAHILTTPASAMQLQRSTSW